MVIPRAPGVSALGGAAVYAVGTEGRQETASGERAPRCQLGAGSPEGGEWDGRGCSLARRGVARGRGLQSRGEGSRKGPGQGSRRPRKLRPYLKATARSPACGEAVLS